VSAHPEHDDLQKRFNDLDRAIREHPGRSGVVTADGEFVDLRDWFVARGEGEIYDAAMVSGRARLDHPDRTVEDLVGILRDRAEEADETRGYGSRAITRRRRSKGEMEVLRHLLRKVVELEKPMTVRQVFYRLVSLGAIAKSEGEYRRTVVRLLTEMRRDGTIPYESIADNSRWMRKPRSYDSLEDALRSTAELYRRRVWSERDVYVEVWLEKEALAGVLYEVTEEWDVPLMVTRGYPSLTFLHQAGRAIAAQGKRTFLYYFGDHDPSGLDIPRKVEEDLRWFAPDIGITFERVAVTPEQIDEWGLPTRPTKETDSRAKSFEGESVEVGAIPPAQLRELVENVITAHVDEDALELLRVAEESERELLYELASRPPEGGGDADQSTEEGGRPRP
jgi:hypothetical protein